MAQVPKTTTTAPAPPPSPTARAQPTTRVASFGDNPVDEPSTSTSISVDAQGVGGFGNETAFSTPRQRGQQPAARPQVFGIINAPTQNFAELFEEGSSATPDGGPPIADQRGFGALVQRAISTYEQNAKVISGTQTITGTEVSVSL